MKVGSNYTTSLAANFVIRNRGGSSHLHARNIDVNMLEDRIGHHGQVVQVPLGLGVAHILITEQ